MRTLRHATTLTTTICLLGACVSDTPVQDEDAVLIEDERDVGGKADAPAPTPDADAPEPDAPATPDVGEPDAAEPEEDMAPPVGRTLMDGITISQVEAYQTIRVPIMEAGGPAAAEIPLVANRETLLRAFVEVEPGWTPRSVDAEFVVEDGAGGAQVFTNTITVAGSSDIWQRGTIFETRVPPELITTASRVHVRLIGDGAVGVDTGTPSGARWPSDGVSAGLGVSDATGTLELVIVPIRWDRDGSGRMPDVSPEQLARFRDAIEAIYPMVELDMTVRQEIAWSNRLDWGDFNVELRRLKTADGKDEAYYYGLVSPDEDFASYCSGTCTTGQSFTVSNASASSYRVGSGVGFTGDRWAWTLVHELGHMHGRGHATCGVSFFSRDRNYPHSGGDIGVWGWDRRSGTLYGPQGATDFMGYCDDLWSSDYTYGGIYDRMSQVWARSGAGAAQGPERAWRWLAWSDEEPARWAGRTLERAPHTGDVCQARGADGAALGLAPLARMSHGGAARALVLESWLEPGAQITLECEGRVVRAPVYRGE